MVAETIGHYKIMEDKKQTWTWTDRWGQVRTKSDLESILSEHRKWVESSGNEGKRADFTSSKLVLADLSGARLQDAIFKKANLSNADLSGAYLPFADLSEAKGMTVNFSGADLTAAKLESAGFQESDFRQAVLVGAHFEEANISKTNFSEAELEDVDFSQATLLDVDFSRSNMTRVKLEKTVFIPLHGTVPASAASALGNLSTVSFIHREHTVIRPDGTQYKSPTERSSYHGLSELRSLSRHAGFREKERQLTYAIRHGEIKLARETGTRWDKIKALFDLILFDFPCKWGMEPYRAVWLLLGFWIAFAVLYSFFLASPSDSSGIWKVWPEKTLVVTTLKADAELISLTWKTTPCWGLWFSLHSTFGIRWGEFAVVGDWITRAIPVEYSLRATGWVKTISGIQSLLGFYLLILWVSSRFGRPFE